jgi:hypothetical protein
MSGLSAEEEARLFGTKAAPPAASDPAKTDFAKAWPRYMSAADHKRWVEELQADRPLRLELRKQQASQPGAASAEDREAAAELNALLTEAEKHAGEEPKEDGSLKPLSPEDAFGLDPGEPNGAGAK